MSERNGTTVTTTATDTGPIEPNTVADLDRDVAQQPGGGRPGEGPQPTAPVTVRPAPRRPGRRSLTRMGPWAPAAGALVGLLLGVVAVLFLAGAVDAFRQRLALVFLVTGLGLLGASGTLLADEVQMMRRGGRALPGLTPGRLLMVAGGFVLFLAAFVSDV